MDSPANTLDYMIAGFTVIFGFMAAYVASLFMRTQKYHQDEIILDEVKSLE
jgi:hypothetical protein